MAKQERAARTRWLLIQAAAETFVQKGFTRASIAAISRQAGVSNGALHFHYETKDALADAVEQSAAALRRMCCRTGKRARTARCSGWSTPRTG